MRREQLTSAMRSRRAMTLTEMTIATGISSLVAVAAIATMILVQKGTTKALCFSKTANASRILSDLIAKDIRSAIGLDASFGSFTAGADTLILRLPSIDADGYVVDVDNSIDYVVYHPGTADPSVLMRTTTPSGASSRPGGIRVIGSLIAGTTCQGTFATKRDALGVFVVHYQFTSSRTLIDETYEVPVSGSLRLRNKK